VCVAKARRSNFLFLAVVIDVTIVSSRKYFLQQKLAAKTAMIIFAKILNIFKKYLLFEIKPVKVMVQFVVLIIF
jgi:hypothetical protein